MTPAENQATIAEELSFLPDPFERLNELVSRSKGLTAIDQAEQIEAFIVHGCQSELWIIPSHDEQTDEWQFRPWSEAPMVAALGQLFCSIFSGCQSEEIKAFEPTLLEDLQLDRSLTPNRQHGARQIVAKIQHYAGAGAA